MDEARIDHPIRQYRDAKGLSLEAFGALVDVEKAAVCKWEGGTAPSPIKAVKIEEATNGAIPKWKLRPDLWDPSDSDTEAERVA